MGNSSFTSLFQHKRVLGGFRSRRKKKLGVLAKESLFKSKLCSVCLRPSDPLEITGGKEKGGDWHHDDFSWAGVVGGGRGSSLCLI